MSWYTADALVFDMDGTLADSMPAHFQAWQAAAERFGFEFSWQRFLELGGVPTRQTLAILCREQTIRLPQDEVARYKEAAVRERLDAVQPIEPVLAVARWGYQQGRPMAVATGASSEVARITLNRLGITDWFRAVKTADDVARHKPDPDVFLEAARAIGAEPARCAAFEDTDIGLWAIRSAGMSAFDVRQPIPAIPD